METVKVSSCHVPRVQVLRKVLHLALLHLLLYFDEMILFITCVSYDFFFLRCRDCCNGIQPS